MSPTMAVALKVKMRPPPTSCRQTMGMSCPPAEAVMKRVQSGSIWTPRQASPKLSAPLKLWERDPGSSSCTKSKPSVS